MKKSANPINIRQQFISNLPVAELHVHIDGTFEPELMWEMATRAWDEANGAPGSGSMPR